MHWVIPSLRRSFWTSTSKQRGSLPLEINSSNIYNEWTTAFWGQTVLMRWFFIIISFRFCTIASSSSYLFSSLSKLCGKSCAFPTGIKYGVRPRYLGFVKTTVIFVLTTGNCYVSGRVTNTKECLWMCAVAWKYNGNAKQSFKYAC